MPAVADIQNTIVREFADDPRVVTAVMSMDEPVERLETFWHNLYLRGQMIHDPDGIIANEAYMQPFSGLPASRAIIIGPDQRVVLPYFGHHPDLIIGTIYDLLGDMTPGDRDGDGDVDIGDFAVFGQCVSGPGGIPEPHCAFFDFDEDGDVDFSDFAGFQLIYTVEK